MGCKRRGAKGQISWTIDGRTEKELKNHKRKVWEKTTCLKNPTILKVGGMSSGGVRRKGAMVFHEEFFQTPLELWPCSSLLLLCIWWINFIKNIAPKCCVFPFSFPFLLFSTSERLCVSLTWCSSFFITAPSQPQRCNFPSCPGGLLLTVQMDIAHVQHILHIPALLGQPQDVLTPLGSAALLFDEQGTWGRSKGWLSDPNTILSTGLCAQLLADLVQRTSFPEF